ncbi:MAG: hypothetical protein PF444_00295 [Bacteroidales bacterium]|jgi:hypothetical protein|nr:hypothetical protein [Bacteroidales bacterium]
MKNRILFGLIALVLGVLCVQAEPVEFQMVADHFTQHAEVYTCSLMAVPLVAHAKVTAELIKELGLQFGTLKIITVVVDPVGYDIDNLGYGDKRDLKALGLEWSIIHDTDIPLEERLKELHKLNKIDGDGKVLAKTLLAKYKGEVTDEGEKHEFLVRRPGRSLIKMLLPLAEQGKIDEFSDKAIKNLVVGGEVDALDDGIVFMGVVSQLRGLIQPAAAFLKKA